MNQLPDGCVLKGCEDPWVSYGLEGECPPVGACCAGEECFLLTEVACAQAGGTWQGAGTNCETTECAPTPPPPTPVGACCIGETCTVTTEAACLAAGGTYQGDNVPCEPNPCAAPPATGACCIGDVCSVMTEAACVEAGGTWQGADTTCEPNPCAVEPLFGCCQGNLDFFPPAYSDEFNRVLDGYLTAGSPADNNLQLWEPECTGVFETLGTRVTGGAAWVPAPVSKFFFGCQEHGAGSDENVGVFDPSDNSISYIGGFAFPAGMSGKNCVYVAATGRVWCKVNDFSDEFAIINPNDLSYTLFNNALLLGTTDYIYDEDNQSMYVLAGGNRLLKIDVNTMAITNLSAAAFAGYSAVSTFTLTYVKSQGKIWYSFTGFRVGPGTTYAIGMIDTTTDARLSVWEVSGAAGPAVRTLWYSEDFDRVLMYLAGETYFLVAQPTITTSGAGALLTIHDYALSWGTKGIYVAGLDEVGIVGVHGGQYCLFWFDRATITAPPA